MELFKFYRAVSTILIESMLRSLSREANRYYKLIEKI